MSDFFLSKASSWHKVDDFIKKNNLKIGWPFTAYSLSLERPL